MLEIVVHRVLSIIRMIESVYCWVWIREDGLMLIIQMKYNIILLQY